MFSQVNAILRREYGVNPAKLPDKEWISLYAEYKFTEKQRYDLMVMAQKQALAEVINQVFSSE
jgi:hypothetical protein